MMYPSSSTDVHIPVHAVNYVHLLWYIVHTKLLFMDLTKHSFLFIDLIDFMDLVYIKFV